MEDGVALIEPAGLGIDQVLHRPAGQGRHAILNLLRADLHDG